ncbi:MAG: hypothetical protein KC964_20060, partial [Candidatus Omnitrophica bacterium]|nr:hypothetical protein [Candidatus Omnitrophota bacterium]
PQSERVRQDCLGLLKNLKEAAERIRPELSGKVDEMVIGLLRIRPAASVLEILGSVREQINTMAMTLQGEIAKREALTSQIRQQYSHIESEFQRIKRRKMVSRLFPRYQSLPDRAWRCRIQEVGQEMDGALLKIAQETQQSLISPSPLDEELLGLIRGLETCRSELASRLRLISTSDFGHRGLGFALTTPADLEREYESSGILTKYGKRLAGELRNFMTDRLLQEQGDLSHHELLQFLEEKVAAISLPEISPVTKSLENHPDRKQILSQTISQAKPLISLDPKFEASNERFMVWLPGGSDNPLASEILEAAKSENCPATPTFHHWEEQEIAFIRTVFNIPALALKSLERANRALRSRNREEQIAAFRLPILWLLPRPGERATDRDLMRLFLIGTVAGFFRKQGERWVHVSEDGTQTDLLDLSIPALRSVIPDYRDAVEAASWFCHQTLERGFAWCRSQMEKVGKVSDLSQGEWPKILLELSEDLAVLARHHHQTF